MQRDRDDLKAAIQRDGLFDGVRSYLRTSNWPEEDKAEALKLIDKLEAGGGQMAETVRGYIEGLEHADDQELRDLFKKVVRSPLYRLFARRLQRKQPP